MVEFMLFEFAQMALLFFLSFLTDYLRPSWQFYSLKVYVEVRYVVRPLPPRCNAWSRAPDSPIACSLNKTTLFLFLAYSGLVYAAGRKKKNSGDRHEISFLIFPSTFQMIASTNPFSVESTAVLTTLLFWNVHIMHTWLISERSSAW